MLTTNEIKAQLNNALEETNFKLGKKYKGKVRDNYLLGDKRIIVTTDRISCFDKVVGTIPFKGQVLNQIAEFWFNETKHIIPNHIIDVPDANVMIVRECKPLEVEIVVRGYITGSLWRAYEKGERGIYGIKFSDGLKKDQKLDEPIITPTTKAEHGQHDEPISKEEIVKRKIIHENIYKQMEDAALKLFAHGTEHLAKNNLILVDTKYEFGLLGKKLVLMDEIHTPDSSRFWYLDFYEELWHNSKEQKMLDKEYVRQWLIGNGFMGDGPIPALTEEVRIEAARRYIEAYDQITGKEFNATNELINERIERNLREKGYLK